MEHDVEPWSGERALPLWLPLPEYAGFLTRDVRDSLAAGSAHPPLARPPGEPWRGWTPTRTAVKAGGLAAEDEATVLREWHVRRGGTPADPVRASLAGLLTSPACVKVSFIRGEDGESFCDAASRGADRPRSAACCRRCHRPSSGSPDWWSPTRPRPPGAPSPTSPRRPRPPRRRSSGSAGPSAWTAIPQLRIRLAAEAARRVEPPDARVVGGDIPPGADLAQIIATIAFNDARAVEETAEQLDPAVCEQVVEAISARQPDRHLRRRRQRLRRLRLPAEAAPHRADRLLLARRAHRADLGGAARPRRRRDRHLAHRHHLRRDRGAGAGPRPRRHDGRADQLPALADHRGRPTTC